MKYILLLFITFPIFTQTIDNSNVDTNDNSKTPTEVKKDSSQPNQNEEPKDNANLTQSDIRKNRKWEISLGYGEGNKDLSPTSGIINMNIQYNLASRFSVGYTHLHERSYSTEFNAPASIFGYIGTTKTENTLEIGLLNFRLFLFEKIPLYLTGGWGRDWLQRDQTRDYQYGYLYRNNQFQTSPLIRERTSIPSEYRFYGLGFQWIFQNGFIIGLEYSKMYSRYTNKGHSIILDPNYTIDGIITEKILFSSDYKGEINTSFVNIKLGYSLPF